MRLCTEQGSFLTPRVFHERPLYLIAESLFGFFDAPAPRGRPAFVVIAIREELHHCQKAVDFGCHHLPAPLLMKTTYTQKLRYAITS